MKKLFYLLLALPLVLLSACGDDDDSGNNSQDSYYVKYEVENGKAISGAAKTTRNITYKTVTSEKVITVVDKPWDGTYGPFKRGDKVYMIISASGKYSTNARLSVSKNKEAFAIKDEFRDATGGILDYIINY